jgi:hypothetical protein
VTREEQGFLAGIDRRFRPFGSTLVLENVAPIARLAFYAGILVTVNLAATGIFLIVNNEGTAGSIGLVTATAFGSEHRSGGCRRHWYLEVLVRLVG